MDRSSKGEVRHACPAPYAHTGNPFQPHMVSCHRLTPSGQILRTAACLSAITGTPIMVDKIRAGRDRPGLRPQHLTGLRLVEEICGEGSLRGGAVGSTEV